MRPEARADTLLKRPCVRRPVQELVGQVWTGWSVVGWTIAFREAWIT
jgi:hypothetical protein